MIPLISIPDSICLCGPTKEIDSTIKIVKDYPKLKKQSDKSEELYKDLKKLTNAERSDILKLIGLDAWDFRKVKSRIRWIKVKKWIWGAAGVGTGAVLTLIAIATIPT
ncbi:hypothetical protein [Runella sp.]|uniref:hypothetical protein n=1 Tax=Runella sp. TaxID=1960881 RepID=UPI003D13C9BF